MQTDDLAAVPGVLNGQATLQYPNKIAVGVFTHLGFQQSQLVSVQIQMNIRLHPDPLICAQSKSTVHRGGVDVSAQLDVGLTGLLHRCLQLVIGVNSRPFRRICRHGGDGHHCQQHHKHQQDANDATSCVCFCHTIISSLKIILKIFMRFLSVHKAVLSLY